MMEALDRSKCPSVIDMISAPMLGHNLRIIALHLSLRASHLRNFEDQSYDISQKIIVMINPIIVVEGTQNQSF